MELKNLNDGQLVKYIEYCMANYSLRYEEMKTGREYYESNQDIDNKKRLAIGKGGRLQSVHNLPNWKIKDNQYARAVDQKVNYLFSEKPNLDCDNEQTLDYVNSLFDKTFMRTLNKIAVDAHNYGIAWMYLYTDGESVKFKQIDPLRVIPIWKDDNHDSLEAVILRVRKEEFEHLQIKIKEFVHLYTSSGVKIYEYENGRLEYVKDEAYLKKSGKSYGYQSVPFVYFRLPSELALIQRVKCLQDALNVLLSNYTDGMLENPGNTIMVIKNYDGEELGEFRRNLATYGAVKVKTADGMQGGVETLEIKVNAENYKVIIEVLKKAIAQNARALYLDNDRTTQAPNSLNIKAMYSDMELDANALELEFSASFEYLFRFASVVTGLNFDGCEVSFKRNIMVNDESTVDIIKNSIGIVSEETLRANHPFVTDPALEEDRIRKQEEEKMKLFDDYQGLQGDA